MTFQVNASDECPMSIPRLELGKSSAMLAYKPIIRPSVRSSSEGQKSAKIPFKQMLKIAAKCIPEGMMNGEIRELEGVLKDKNFYVVKLKDQFSYLKIGKQIGAGSFSVVYSVIEAAGPAIKEYGDLVVKTSSRALDHGGVEDTAQEIEAGKYKLPYVVLTHASYIYKATDKIHMIMLQQSLKGGALQNLIKAQNIPITLKVETIRQFATGEKELQDHHIFHRDIRPGNAMLLRKVSASKGKTSDIQVRLIDFGNHINLEKYEDPKYSLTWSGTYGYAAPELIALQGYKPPSDTIGKPDTSTIGLVMARKMLYTNGKIDDEKIEGFHRAVEVYAFSVSAFETLFAELPKMAMKVIEAGAMAMYHGQIETRDTNYPEPERVNLFEEAKENGVSDDLMALVWQGLSPDPTERPPIEDFKK